VESGEGLGSMTGMALTEVFAEGGMADVMELVFNLFYIVNRLVVKSAMRSIMHPLMDKPFKSRTYETVYTREKLCDF